MSHITSSQVELDKIFKSQRGNSEYTKAYCHAHAGEYEVFTGTTLGIFGNIDTFDYEIPNLTYTTDGVNAGSVDVLSGKYNVGGHRAILTPLLPNVYLPYFQMVLEPAFKKMVKSGNVPSVTWTNVKKAIVSVPIDLQGKFDIEAQKELSNRLTTLKEKKKELQRYQARLRENYVFLPLTNAKYVDMPLRNLFQYIRGRSCTKAHCNKHKGIYPVWSANNIDPLAYVDFYDYEGTYISLSRNGIAGKLKILSGKFTINEDRFLLVPTQRDIDLDYVRFIIEPILRSKTKGRAGHNGQNEFTKLSFTILDTISIAMPVLDDGSYDLAVQQTVAYKYNTVNKVKDGLCHQIEKVIDAQIII